jgi:hypothetical protein
MVWVDISLFILDFDKTSGFQSHYSESSWDRAFAWSGDAKKLSSNDNFGKNVVKYSKLGQNERFLLHWVGLGTL